jgi:hypothetical protein
MSDRQHTPHLGAGTTTASARTKHPVSVRTGQPHPAASSSVELLRRELLFARCSQGTQQDLTLRGEIRAATAPRAWVGTRLVRSRQSTAEGAPHRLWSKQPVLLTCDFSTGRAGGNQEAESGWLNETASHETMGREEMMQATMWVASTDPLWVVDTPPALLSVSVAWAAPTAVRGCAEKMRPIAEMP